MLEGGALPFKPAGRGEHQPGNLLGSCIRYTVPLAKKTSHGLLASGRTLPSERRLPINGFSARAALANSSSVGFVASQRFAASCLRARVNSMKSSNANCSTTFGGAELGVRAIFDHLD